VRSVPELEHLESIIHRLPASVRIRTELVVPYERFRFPIYSIMLGPERPDTPIVAFFGGVHGLERIGSQVVSSFLSTIASSLEWDDSLGHLLDRIRIAFYPIVNPGGMYLNRRSNPNGVDLMRNAPIDVDEPRRFFLPGGHRISPALPWYRGEAGKPMEAEAQAMCDFVRREIFQAPYAVALDVHSGFGFEDRLWFPFSSTRKLFPHLPEVYALTNLLNRTLTNHIYRPEPQSHSYMMNGDLWDYLYFEHQTSATGRVFLPLCLEMGSWAWVKKNPKQLLSIIGLFNPILPHRIRRTLRRHLPLFDFLVRSTFSWRNWQPREQPAREQLLTEAIDHWYKPRRHAS
jgi:hypothetical protein